MRALMVALSVVGLFGCKTPCRQLSEKLCDCTLGTSERTACLQAVGTREGGLGVVLTSEQEDTCESLLEVCDCRLIDTPSGKERCGLATPAN